MSKSGKGSSFEREICKKLSLWWSDGTDEDIFWRTSGSGARAKTRSKKGKSTFGQYGDIQATNPIGQPLIDVCTIELKRGYSRSTFADIVDKPKGAKPQLYEEFIEQASTDSLNSGSFSWLLITKRDRREALVFVPYLFVMTLSEHYVCKNGIFDMTELAQLFIGNTTLYIYNLDSFLEMINPSTIKEICLAEKARKDSI